MGEVQYKELSRLYYEIQAEFNNLSNNSITQIELDRLKTIRLNDYNNSLYDPERFSNFIQDNYNFNGYSLEKISNKWAQINSVTLEEINNAASKIFDADNLMMVVVGNKDSCATFLEQFENVEYYEQTEELRTSASSP
jgi:predicted Zn-dependent peptidase